MCVRVHPCVGVGVFLCGRVGVCLRSQVRRGLPAAFEYRSCPERVVGGDISSLMRSGGESVVLGFMSELWPGGAVGRAVFRQFGGGAPRALHDAG